MKVDDRRETMSPPAGGDASHGTDSMSGKGIQLRGLLWMVIGKHNFGGHGRIRLLEKIDQYGSIARAAKEMKMSYKAAWDTIDAMNNLASGALVERRTGGKNGGGSCLTTRGRRLITVFKRIECEHRRFVMHLNAQIAEIDDDIDFLRRIAMKTSARNQFTCKVTEVKKGAVNDEIVLQTSSGQNLVAIVTRESSDNLQLKSGAEAFALIKASSIIVVADDSGAKFSARNRLDGKISRLTPGAVNTEVVIDVANGGAITAIITNESSKALGLAEGKPASAIFKASSVIVGVPA